MSDIRRNASICSKCRWFDDSGGIMLCYIDSLSEKNTASGYSVVNFKDAKTKEKWSKYTAPDECPFLTEMAIVLWNNVH